MKLGELKCLGHNLADSFIRGVGLLVGVYAMDVFAEAAASEAGYIEVSFLDANATGSSISATLQGVIKSYINALPELCKKHRIDPSQIKALILRFGTDSVYGLHFIVSVERVSTGAFPPIATLIFQGGACAQWVEIIETGNCSSCA